MTNTKQSAEIMDERKAFEAWAESSGRYFDLDCDVNQDGTVLYMHENARYAWAAWMERAVLSAQANDAQDRYFSFEFEVWQGDEMCASTSGPRDTALNEAMRYAEQYRQDGTVRIFEVKHVLIEEIQGMQTGSGERHFNVEQVYKDERGDPIQSGFKMYKLNKNDE